MTSRPVCPGLPLVPTSADLTSVSMATRGNRKSPRRALFPLEQVNKDERLKDLQEGLSPKCITLYCDTHIFVLLAKWNISCTVYCCLLVVFHPGGILESVRVQKLKMGPSNQHSSHSYYTRIQDEDEAGYNCQSKILQD